MPPLLAVCFAKTVNPCAWAKSDFIVFTSLIFSPDKDKLTIYEACVYQRFTVSPQERKNMCLVNGLGISPEVDLLVFCFSAALFWNVSPTQTPTQTFLSSLAFQELRLSWWTSNSPKGECTCAEAPSLINLIPDLCWRKNWAFSSFYLPCCTLVHIRRKNNNRCSCHVLDLDLVEMHTEACIFCSSWRQSELWGLRSLREKEHMLKTLFTVRTVMQGCRLLT